MDAKTTKAIKDKTSAVPLTKHASHCTPCVRDRPTHGRAPPYDAPPPPKSKHCGRRMAWPNFVRRLQQPSWGGTSPATAAHPRNIIFKTLTLQRTPPLLGCSAQVAPPLPRELPQVTRTLPRTAGKRCPLYRRCWFRKRCDTVAGGIERKQHDERSEFTCLFCEQQHNPFDESSSITLCLVHRAPLRSLHAGIHRDPRT